MSMSYWICEGVGIRVNQLRPFLNPQKCIQLLKEQLPGEEILEDGFDIDDYLYGEPFENLADVFTTLYSSIHLMDFSSDYLACRIHYP